MNTLEFLRAVWPDEGLYCIAIPYPNKGYDHHVFKTIDEAVDYVETVKANKNVFFATHTLKQEKVWDPKHHRDDTDVSIPAKERPYFGGWRYRTQTNMRSSKILFFDLDCEEGNAKKYRDQTAAYEDLKVFCKGSGLPKPMVVSSGGGLHVYWLLDSEVESTAWGTLASRLKQLAHHFGLKIDNSRTTDTSSVLRVADTFNCKRKPYRPVEVLVEGVVTNVQAFRDLLASALKAASIDAPDARPNFAKIESNLDTSSHDRPAPGMKSLITACGQVARIAEVRGKTSDEPEWWNLAGIIKHVINPEKNFRKISEGHPDYDEATTDDKLDRWQAGPTSCVKFRDACGPSNDHICASCPFWGKVYGPVQAAQNTDSAPPPTVTMIVHDVETEVEIVNPPVPYKRTRDGGISELVEGKEGRQFEVKIFSYDLYPLERAQNEGSETEVQRWRAHMPHGLVKTFTVDSSTFVDDRKLRERLAGFGIYTSKFDKLKEYMSAYIQELQKQKKVGDQQNHLGWINEATQFVMPDWIFNPDGTVTTTHLTEIAEEARSFIGKKGTVEEQVRLMNFYNTDPRHISNRWFVLNSLASILLHLTGHRGLIVHAQGLSGASKTSTLFTAASMWGNPERYIIDCTDTGATMLARSIQLNVLNSLPGMLDEITGIREDQAKGMALASTQRGDRKRATRGGLLQKTLTGGDKSAITMTTGNVSLQSLLAVNNSADDAGAVRVFEMTFLRDLGIYTPVEEGAYVRGLFENHGHIGEKFAQVVVANKDKIKEWILNLADDLQNEGIGRSQERFWFADAACVLVACKICRDLGLLNYDLNELRQWFLKVQLPYMRGFVVEQVSVNASTTILTDYLGHIAGKTIQTRLYPGTGREEPTSKPNGEIIAHQFLSTQIMWISMQDFKVYCEGRKRFNQEVLRDLKHRGIVVTQDVMLEIGKGTDMSKGKSRCFIVNLKHTDLATVVPQLEAVGASGDASNVSQFRKVAPNV